MPEKIYFRLGFGGTLKHFLRILLEYLSKIWKTRKKEEEIFVEIKKSKATSCIFVRVLVGQVEKFDII